jgi:hypothetical protein
MPESLPPNKYVTKERRYKCKHVGNYKCELGAGRLGGGGGGGKHGPKLTTWHGQTQRGTH